MDAAILAPFCMYGRQKIASPAALSKSAGRGPKEILTEAGQMEQQTASSAVAAPTEQACSSSGSQSSAAVVAPMPMAETTGTKPASASGVGLDGQILFNAMATMVADALCGVSIISDGQTEKVVDEIPVAFGVAVGYGSGYFS